MNKQANINQSVTKKRDKPENRPVSACLERKPGLADLQQSIGNFATQQLIRPTGKKEDSTSIHLLNPQSLMDELRRGKITTVQCKSGEQEKSKIETGYVDFNFKYLYDESDVLDFVGQRYSMITAWFENYAKNHGLDYKKDFLSLVQKINTLFNFIDKDFGLPETRGANKQFVYHIRALAPPAFGDIQVRMVSPVLPRVEKKVKPPESASSETPKNTELLMQLKKNLNLVDDLLNSLVDPGSETPITRLKGFIKKVRDFLDKAECAVNLGEPLGKFAGSLWEIANAREKSEVDKHKAFDNMLERLKEVLLVLAECLAPFDSKDVKEWKDELENLFAEAQKHMHNLTNVLRHANDIRQERGRKETEGGMGVPYIIDK